MEKYNFQYCPKLVIFSKDIQRVFLCKRKGEQDYNGTFSFIGGKMEKTDESIEKAIRREKIEEVGDDFNVRLNIKYSANVFFSKKDGSKMILPHYYAIHEKGEPKLNEEYSGYKWVPIEDLKNFEPKIETIPPMVESMIYLMKIQAEEDFIEI